MGQKVGHDRPRQLSLAGGFAILGLAAALALFIERLAASPDAGLQLPDEVPRAIALPALYVTAGLLAIVGARQARPAIVLAAGVLCLMGGFVSVATVLFLAPGLLLVAFSIRMAAKGGGIRSDALVAIGLVVLVATAAVALLGSTEGRCWEATGTTANPVYVVVPCSAEPVVIGPGDVIASGYNGGVLTTKGVLLEAVLLLVALGLAAVTRPRPAGIGRTMRRIA